MRSIELLERKQEGRIIKPKIPKKNELVLTESKRLIPKAVQVREKLPLQGE